MHLNKLIKQSKATDAIEKISDAESFKDKCTFLSSFHFRSDNFSMGSHGFDFDTLRNKANVKGSLRKKLEYWYDLGANPSVIDSTKFNFSLLLFDFFFKIINLPFRTQTL